MAVQAHGLGVVQGGDSVPCLHDSLGLSGFVSVLLFSCFGWVSIAFSRIMTCVSFVSFYMHRAFCLATRLGVPALLRF